ncbi:hypothetical protein, partial [Helicobacter didelphidarum]
LNPIQDSRFFKELGMREDNKHKESGIKARDKLLVSSVYAEIRERESKENISSQQENCPNNNANTICIPTRTYNFDTSTLEDTQAQAILQNTSIYLKAYYNQDSIPNKDKQSQTQRQQYQAKKKQTKWGYITSSPYQHTTKENISFPIKEHETFKILTDLEGNEIIGEEIIINLREEWLDKQVRFFAFVENPKYEVGITLHIYSPMQYKEEGLIDVSGYIIGFVGAIGKNVVVRGVKFASEIQGSIYVKRENRETQGMPKYSLSNQEAREWYVNTQLPKIKELGNKILTLEERAKFHFNFRNQAKKDTRDAMRDRAEAGRLEFQEKNKTWEEWIEYVRTEKGLTKMEDIYNYTIKSSSRSRPSVNENLGVIPK